MSHCCQCDKQHNRYYGSCCSKACKKLRDAKMSLSLRISNKYEDEQKNFRKEGLSKLEKR